MSIENLSGAAAEGAANEADFSGTLSPRRYKISESLQDKALTLMDAAFRNQWGAPQKLAEAFSTSDFTLAAFAAIDKQMLAAYNELPENWRAYTDVSTVNDFRPATLMDRWRNTVGLAAVPELHEYPAEDDRGSDSYQISVSKFGRRFAISWESWINNTAIQELEDLPQVLARQARETEAINAVSNLIAADRNGVNLDFFKAGNGNAPTAAPLTAANLDSVLASMALKTPRGKVVARPALQVLIPAALEPQARKIKSALSIRETIADGDDSVTTEYSNYLQSVDFVVDPFLDFWNVGTKAATTWFVLPKTGSGRPALHAAFLRGHEAPDLRVKADTGKRVGGGDVSPLDGSFEIDDIQYRCRHIVGRATGDPTFTYVSNGA